MLREFLYVDTDKVRSLLAQLDEGIGEEVRITEKNQTKLSIGTKNILNHDRDSGSESSVTRSLADAIFPTLEEAMESSGYLVDISEELRNPDLWTNGLQERYPAGSFVRITAPARLFDSRYVLRVFAGLSATANGYTALVREMATGQSKGRPQSTKAKRVDGGSPEDDIEDFPTDVLGGGLTAPQLRAFARLTRGMFHPGLLLVMNPAGRDGLAVTARLEEGRRFLESSDAEVLFARYGVYEQEWTVVGTIGSHSSEIEAVEGQDNFYGQRNSGIDRAVVTNRVNSLMARVAHVGFADLPQYPGFSVVPFAVYRPIIRLPATALVTGAAV